MARPSMPRRGEINLDALGQLRVANTTQTVTVKAQENGVVGKLR